MFSSSLNPLFVVLLHQFVVFGLLFEPRKRHEDHFQRVADAAPSFADDLSAFFVAHAWKLGFNVSSSFSLVNAVRTYLFEWTLDADVDSVKDLLLLGFQLLLLNLNAFVACLVLSHNLRLVCRTLCLAGELCKIHSGLFHKVFESLELLLLVFS